MREIGIINVEVKLKNPRTDEVKSIAVGWSWVLFLFSGWLGIPLFLRGLYLWGIVMIVLWPIKRVIYEGLAEVITQPLTEYVASQSWFLWAVSLIFLLINVYLGANGNEITAKDHIKKGWVFAEPSSENTKFAMRKWRIQPQLRQSRE